MKTPDQIAEEWAGKHFDDVESDFTTREVIRMAIEEAIKPFKELEGQFRELTNQCIVALHDESYGGIEAIDPVFVAKCNDLLISIEQKGSNENG